jgi:hypothetical protein
MRGSIMLQLIASAYSTHIRANVRVYQSSEGDYKVDWRFSHGGYGVRAFPGVHEALSYFQKLHCFMPPAVSAWWPAD